MCLAGHDRNALMNYCYRVAQEPQFLTFESQKRFLAFQLRSHLFLVPSIELWLRDGIRNDVPHRFPACAGEYDADWPSAERFDETNQCEDFLDALQYLFLPFGRNKMSLCIRRVGNLRGTKVESPDGQQRLKIPKRERIRDAPLANRILELLEGNANDLHTIYGCNVHHLG